jgi:hypothetical protein
LCERKVADIKIDRNDETDDEEQDEIIELALHVRKVVAMKIDSNDETDDEEEISEINSDDDDIEDKEETLPWKLNTTLGMWKKIQQWTLQPTKDWL